MFVYSFGEFVATVAKQDKRADSFNAAEPWMVLHNTGRIDRFESQREARAEAVKTYPAAKFKMQ